MLEQLTHQDWCRFIGSIIKQYIVTCRRDRLVEPDDLEQEAWHALLLAAQNYQTSKSDAKFTSYAWIYINYSVRELVYPKQRLKHKTIFETDMSEGMLDIEDQFDDFIGVEDDEVFKAALGELNAEDFVLIDQHFVRGMTFKEMASLDSVTPQAMQQRFKRVIDKLKKHFNIENLNRS
jgi:RNA polymerase sigma factor (sigma-70 family)